MTEKYKPKSARGRIAQGVEITAGKEFGPERLTKQDVARALNLTETELPDEDWREISEFAVNAGCDLIRASVDTYLPKNPNRKEVHDIRETIAASSKDRLPFHDIFHAAETYRLSGGASAAARLHLRISVSGLRNLKFSLRNSIRYSFFHFLETEIFRKMVRYRWRYNLKNHVPDLLLF